MPETKEAPATAWTRSALRRARPVYPESDARRVEKALKKRLLGEVRFDDQAKGLYSTDASNYRQTPIGVVIPRSIRDVEETVRICRRFDAPVLSRGGGTSLAGQCCNVAVIIDFSKYLNQVMGVNAVRRTATVRPGAVLDWLQSRAVESGLVFGPDPATHAHCTLGGMLGNNSCGIHSVMAGRMADNVVELEVLIYDGHRFRVGCDEEERLEEIIRQGGKKGEIYARLKALRDEYADDIRGGLPAIPRRSSGFNLEALLPENGFNVAAALVGTEGTCATILEGTVRLVPNPRHRALAVLGYPSVYEAADHVDEIMRHRPIGLEGIDDELVGYQRKKRLNLESLPKLPDGKGWLLVEFGGDSDREAADRARAMLQAVTKGRQWPKASLFLNPHETESIWQIRESGLGATARVPGHQRDFWPGWEDSAVPPEKLGNYLRDLRGLFQKYAYEAALYGHFGQGCVHCRVNFDLSSREGLDTYRAFAAEAADLCAGYGGSLSGEHGDGQSRGELLPRMFPPRVMRAFRRFKAIWDPDNRMNPGKVVEPYGNTDNLRLGLDYHPAQPETQFRFPQDAGSFAYATLRCVGVGKCRDMEGGVMCPSWRVTMEEAHTTRGRAHLLHEMLAGEIPGGFRSEAVKESLDLCLSCKGCLGDCPVNVDLATYKAEFLSHYYRGRLRPMAAYSMGLIYWAASWASRYPGLANFFTQTPLISRITKKLGGISAQRTMPRFAPVTFREWFTYRAGRRRRDDAFAGAGHGSKGKVLFWPDTFNNFFEPAVAAAGVQALEDAGYQVEIPRRPLCCGRPLYDFGMLDLARRQLRQILDHLREPIRKGVPLVGLEPSCVAVFRDELRNLFPDDEDAQRLGRQTFLLEEFLMRREAGYRPPRLAGLAIWHGHCHQKAVMGTGELEKLMDGMGLQRTEPESSCCGMAGSFGYEAEKYPVSSAIAERHLLPAVRLAARDTLILANGFSCRGQIRDGSSAGPIHIAEALVLAEHGREGLKALESSLSDRRSPAARRKRRINLGVPALLGLAWYWTTKGRRA